MRTLALATLAGFCAFSALALAAEDKGAANKTPEVVHIYSSRHYDVDDRIHKLFSEKTGIQVRHVQVKEATQLVERVKAEGPHCEADVLMTVDVGNLWRAEEAGILAPSDVPAAKERIAAELRHPNGNWYAVSMRARVLAYNKDKVKPSEINTYEDLTQERWKGRILVRSSNHVYNQSLVASFLFHRGSAAATDWVMRVAGNLARRPEGGDTDQIRAVAAGIGDVAIVNSYYVARLLKSTKPEDQAVAAKIGVVFPNQDDRGTHVNISGVAVAKHARRKDLAEKFIAFVLSDEVQKLYAEENGEYPAVASVPLPPVLAQLGRFKADTASLAAIGKQTPIAVRVMDKSAWR